VSLLFRRRGSRCICKYISKTRDLLVGGFWGGRIVGLAFLSLEDIEGALGVYLLLDSGLICNGGAVVGSRYALRQRLVVLLYTATSTTPKASEYHIQFSHPAESFLPFPCDSSLPTTLFLARSLLHCKITLLAFPCNLHPQFQLSAPFFTPSHLKNKSFCGMSDLSLASTSTSLIPPLYTETEIVSFPSSSYQSTCWFISIR